VAEEFQEGDLVMDGCVLGLTESVGLRVRVCEGVMDGLEVGVTEELGLGLVVRLAV
jgi:hypothetical protein